MVTALIAYDGDGRVIHTLEYLVLMDPDRNVGVGVVDFEAHELAGGKLREICHVAGAVGSGTWPEFLGESGHEFHVELDGKRIVRLRHHRSGHVRHRQDVEAAIEKRRLDTVKAVRKAAKVRDDTEVTIDAPFDVSDITGIPGLPLDLDDNGRTRKRVKGDAPRLPLHVSAAARR